jgi:2-keto-4-pentenoate hydratase/2-oxohepta-3-ene-1,7-dioic acid hydratase in catechol pathway
VSRAYASVLDGDSRRAAFIDGEEVFVSSSSCLEDVISGRARIDGAGGRTIPLGDARFDAPLRPPAVLCSGQNYHDHLDEKATAVPSVPEFFLKAGQTISGPEEPCRLDARVTTKLDYETELGVVIGRSGRHIKAADALDHVWGYVVVNDLTARERQVKFTDSGDMYLDVGPSKNFDGATRLARGIVRADDVGDPQSLALSTTVSGELRQSNTTANMIFSVASIIEYLSTLLTLQPGTIIATGTPGGTAWGQDKELGGTKLTPPGCAPGRYLSPGDTVESEIERVGSLAFDVVDP